MVDSFPNLSSKLPYLAHFSSQLTASLCRSRVWEIPGTALPLG